MKNKSSWISVFSALSVLTAVVTLSSGCDSDTIRPSVTNEQGSSGVLYSAILSPIQLNSQFANASGTAQFAVVSGTLTSTVTMSGLNANTAQLQYVDFANLCPTAANDANGDGVVDAVESAVTTGAILLPLSNSLLNLASNSFPMSDANGNFTYTQSVSYPQLLGVLHGTSPSASPSPSSSVSPSPSASPSEAPILATGVALSLQSRVVVVYGVASGAALPGTAQGMSGFTAQESLPIACGPISTMTLITNPTPAPSPSHS